MGLFHGFVFLHFGDKNRNKSETIHKKEKNSIFGASKSTIMKNVLFSVLVSILVVFGSCSTDVNIYSDYKDIAVIYAMLDSRSDTNFVKITRAFCGSNDDPINATEVALIADSSNYPGKLDARIIELKSSYGNTYETTGRVILLDTMTIHNKEEGVFYAPHQKVYYTTEKLYTGTSQNRYKYQLVVVKPNGDTVKATTSMVGNEELNVMSNRMSFQAAPTEATGKLVFRADGIAPLYDLKIQFNYLEQHTGQAVEKKYVSRSFGAKSIYDFARVEGCDDLYYLEYSLNWLFNALDYAIGSDTVVNGNHPNVVRYIGDFVVSISAAGDDLYYYYLGYQAQQSSPFSLVSTYTNISGGSGLFSSRTTIEKTLGLSSTTKRDLFSISAWGFSEH